MGELTSGNIYVADEDIVCYKIVFKTEHFGEVVYVSSWYGKIYREGCWYKEDVASIVSNEKVEIVWMYAPVYDCWLQESVTVGYDDGYICVTGSGFYSYTHFMDGSMCEHLRDIVNRGEKPSFARCRIPKGAIYCVSDNGETFVSDKIVFEKVLDIDTLVSGYELCRFEY